MADDQGFGDVGFRGHPLLRTPCLDELAKVAIRFDRFYAAAPVCSPTRGSCLTGRHPFRYGIVHANQGHLPAEEVTLAEVLHEHGYRTGHFGKWHLGTMTRTTRDSNRGGEEHAEHYSPPWEHGFDHCFSTEAKV
ncbi:MAG: sulfatase-like hydrolase/transferase, partial [Planctomycetes bacterium]|nr:sulfatase-like hydrolase/transferase [Planctomycetota bacterium]